MKKLVIIPLIVCAIVFSSFHKDLKYTISDFSKFDKLFVRANIGVRDGGGEKYACKFETRNVDYALFLADIKKQDNKELYNKCMYDSTAWYTKYLDHHSEPNLFKTYHSSIAYKNCPIVNISHEAALEYCKWLNQKYEKANKKPFKKVEFYLPSIHTWMYSAALMPGHSLPWYGNYGYTPDGVFMANIKLWYNSTSGVPLYTSDGARYTGPCGLYDANKWGLFDMIGNVSEMLSKDSVQIGGNWDCTIEECRLDTVQHYTLPDPRVGFRVFMRVLEE